MFQAQNRETINSTRKVAVSFEIITTMSVTRPCFTTQHQTCKTKIKTKTDFFWFQTGLVPRPDGLRLHHRRILSIRRKMGLSRLAFQGHSRSMKLTRIDRLPIISY